MKLNIYFFSNIIGSIDRVLSIYYSMRSNIKAWVIQLRISFRQDIYYPIENYPIENYPIENYPIENYPIENYPIENYPIENYPFENYPFENYPLRIRRLLSN